MHHFAALKLAAFSKVLRLTICSIFADYPERTECPVQSIRDGGVTTSNQLCKICQKTITVRCDILACLIMRTVRAFAVH